MLLPTEGWPNLRAFAIWFLKDFPAYPIRPPHDDFRQSPGSSGLIIFRAEPFQAELVQFEPGHVVPPHTHPTVSAYDIHLAGTGMIELGGRVLRPRPPVLSDPLRSRVPVVAGVVHSGEAGPDGAKFLSLQHWHAGMISGHITDDWA